MSTGTGRGLAPDIEPTGMFHNRYTLLFISLMLLLAASPAGTLAQTPAQLQVARVIFIALFGVVMLTAVLVAARGRFEVITASTLAVPALGGHGLARVLGTEMTAWVGDVWAVLFLGFVIVVVLRFIFTTRRVTQNTIAAALCVYLLMGVLWAEFYSLLEHVWPNSFRVPELSDEEASMQFGGEGSVIGLYYSFVTLTTLGYGEVTPTHPFARMTAALEAVVGQFYLTVLVAWLVGLRVSQPSAAGARQS
jgi:hypothetical protein